MVYFFHFWVDPDENGGAKVGQEKGTLMSTGDLEYLDLRVSKSYVSGDTLYVSGTFSNHNQIKILVPSSGDEIRVLKANGYKFKSLPGRQKIAIWDQRGAIFYGLTLNSSELTYIEGNDFVFSIDNYGKVTQDGDNRPTSDLEIEFQDDVVDINDEIVFYSQANNWQEVSMQRQGSQKSLEVWKYRYAW